MILQSFGDSSQQELCKQISHNEQSKTCSALIPVQAEYEEGGNFLSRGTRRMRWFWSCGPQEVDEAGSESVSGAEEIFELDTVEDLVGNSDDHPF